MEEPLEQPPSIHGREDSGGVETAMVLSQFGRSLGAARRGYIQFMKDGGMERYYETVDQRFLGDEGFIEQVGKREIEIKGPRISFGRLVEAVAEVHGVRAAVLAGLGRQRGWLKARGMLVYLGREWARLKVKELGRGFTGIHP